MAVAGKYTVAGEFFVEINRDIAYIIRNLS